MINNPTFRKGLLDLFTKTGGSTWHKMKNWGTEAPFSLWDGIVVDHETSIPWIVDLRDNNAKGPMPDKLLSDMTAEFGTTFLLSSNKMLIRDQAVEEKQINAVSSIFKALSPASIKFEDHVTYYGGHVRAIQLFSSQTSRPAVSEPYEVSFADLPLLKYAAISNSRIEKVVGGEGLEILNLSGNLLKSLPLQILNKIRWMNVSRNQITQVSVPDGSMQKLFELNLAGNPLEQIDVDKILNLPNLLALHLEGQVFKQETHDRIQELCIKSAMKSTRCFVTL